MTRPWVRTRISQIVCSPPAHHPRNSGQTVNTIPVQEVFDRQVSTSSTSTTAVRRHNVTCGVLRPLCELATCGTRRPAAIRRAGRSRHHDPTATPLTTNPRTLCRGTVRPARGGRQGLPTPRTAHLHARPVRRLARLHLWAGPVRTTARHHPRRRGHPRPERPVLRLA